MARSDIRDVEIHRLRDAHHPLIAIIITSPAPRSRGLGRRQGDRVAPRVDDFRLPIRRSVVEDAVRLVEFVAVGVVVTAGRLVDFVELAVLPASAGRVVAAFTRAVAV